jgi:hypothetical protein
MASATSLTLLAIAALSWLLSLYLLFRLWRSVDLLTIKIGLSVVLLAPVVGPLAYFWIQAFPDPMPVEFRQPGFGGVLIHKWRNWFEATGRLPPMVQYFRKRRRKK